ncbi:MAG: TetR/AcrR family transcriptional regulator [Hydrogenophaga sp.]|jgi:AcrR family transcriptional regulator|uniref:TetR/AcrR family transcriptional regulator n=1 Tax=Hydrogenophaga sp. TaxID=1904254 RepID=UPI00271567D5|nr:TetR/AcrR family transcriptional regulator [Hydrogenophaga sp.]MDO9250798.1 TetR/AcrR family transcriptional regulator [Hydrogenophaga sp.]MDP2408041.1 TetR/AcrR family transcriptional regulator [Hydrogenophaga sp.]MDP3322529.1 TetR/AcrR family transcriptional regulator [Hydrogenophaga sp.]MDZ4174833.1 TetR/AcrR family transcriptional regulator [Hydrogenophaga sp.]
MAAKKPPRRTAERILEVTLELFNRFGEPNVSTTLISAELGISPGNLYYHYPAKDELINSLFERYEHALGELLGASDSVRNVEDAWFFLHSLFEIIWQYRFLYRDLNDLLSKNRLLETRFQGVLKNKSRAIRALLSGMSRSGALDINARELEPTANCMVVVLTYWLSFEYVRDPRHALEPDNAQHALMRGAQHVLNLLAPYLEAGQRQHLLELTDAYNGAAT